MRRNDDIAQVRLGEQRLEEPVGVRHAVAGDEIFISEEAVTPTQASGV